MQPQLHDSTGKPVQQVPLTAGRNLLAKPAGIASGLYLYTIGSRQKPIGSGKLLVR